MSHQICEHCHKNVATVTVIEIPPRNQAGAEAATQNNTPPRQQILCEICAQAKDLPHAPVAKKGIPDVWKLLQASGAKASPRVELVCPDCGMTLNELRKRGRIGCANDYEVFAKEIHDILERVHGATEHVGRVPGLSPDDLNRMQTISTLRRDLDHAIREEAYESAARIRDELEALEGSA